MTKSGKVAFVNIDQLKRCFALLWRAGIPCNVVGGVGSGKTTAVVEFVEELNQATGNGYKLWKLIASVMEPSDFGVPVPVDGKLRHLAPEFLPFDCDDKGVILADEFDRAKPDVQNSFLQLLLGGEIHGHEISKDAYMIMTMNGESDIYTTPLSMAARTRVCTLYVSSNAQGTLESWDNWAEREGISPLMRGFARFRPELIEAHEDFEELSLATSRTRDMADAILIASEEVEFKTADILMPCLSGVVGKAVAVELMGYKKMVDACPDPLEIIKNPETADVPDQPGILYAVGIALLGHVQPDEGEKAEAVVKYAVRMPKEICAFVLLRLGEKCPKVIATKSYLKWVEENKVVLS